MASTVHIGDLTVNRLGFGAMRVCGTNIWGPPKDRAAAHAVLRKAFELGFNFFDTATVTARTWTRNSSLKRCIPTPRAW